MKFNVMYNCFVLVAEKGQNWTRTAHKDPMDEDAKRRLLPYLEYEYKFYNYVKERFYKLYESVKMMKTSY